MALVGTSPLSEQPHYREAPRSPLIVAVVEEQAAPQTATATATTPPADEGGGLLFDFEFEDTGA